MKKITLLFTGLMLSTFVYSQNANVVSAINYINDFERSNDVESLKKAKDKIDLASVHENTKGEAKTMVYRGKIYLKIFENNQKTNMDKLKDISDPGKKNNIAYQNTSSEELLEALTAYTNAKTFDTKNIYSDEIKRGIANSMFHLENKAINDYNAKKYPEALAAFEKVYENSKDTSALSNCAMVARNAQNYDKAIMYYQKMIDANVGKSKTYNFLYNVYLEKKDTTGALAVLTKGINAYPNDYDLLIAETNYYLQKNNSEKALANLNKTIESKPNESNLYLVRANVYDNMANPKDEKGVDKPKSANYDELLAKAEADYKKTIELKPDSYDAMYNLGVLYNNHGVQLTKEADKITDQKKYDAVNSKATDEFKKAMPVLEKAMEMNPTDKAPMLALKQIYVRLGLTDKYNAIKDKLK